MCQDRQERPESSSFHILAPSSLGPGGRQLSFYPDNPHYTEVTSAPQPFQSCAGMSPAYLASQRTSPGFPVCAGMNLIYTLTGGPGGNFPRVCGDVCGDKPDRHAYILDLVKLLYICPVLNFGACPRRQHLSRRWLFIIDCIT